MRASVRRWFGVLLMVAGGLSHADTYEYDEVGNLKTLSSPRGTRTYTYDEVDRLDTEAGFTGSRNHAYDVNGNRTTDAASAPGTPTTATYTSNTNRIVTINGAAVSLDAAGQITNDGLNSYTWDDAGRLKSVSRAGQLRATYHYDHKHRRTRKVSTAAAPQGAKTIVYHYDDRDRLMAETSDTGVPIRSYAWADENLISQVEYAPNATSTGYDIARILYFELDQLGTPRQARERVGTIVWRWESDGYGTSPANEDPDGNGQPTTVNLRFPGQYFDEESGLHYNWHRYYVPRLGRYLSSDPIGVAGGNNTFAYVLGNPLSYTDPRGLEWPGQVWNGERWVYPPDESKREHCVTAECVAGLLPAPIDVRTQRQVDQGQCELVCGWAWFGPLLPFSISKLPAWAAGQLSGYFGCKHVCKEGAVCE
ncbi:MAG: RHS repeat-associated core domain-containing protein [Methyloversatilis sp.]|nr:RHS repeat-associated core domain-containing protein [Methyloversatilis sp.]MDP2869408.1 RHS repeat-associated core domain-containing protein [Methyloversatilis sp.]